VPEEAVERRKMPIYLGANYPHHAIFWSAMKRRELAEVDGPLEWWWRLLVLRYRGIQRASQALIRAAISDEPILDKGIIVLTNPSLKEEGRYAKKLIDGSYKQPTHVMVTLRVSREAKHEGLAFALDDASFRARFISKMIDLAVIRS
jgi:MoxR-like ATPase